ncbi:MAG: hypothetical protein AAGF25_13890 [Pseudomonadota bacterium]
MTADKRKDIFRPSDLEPQDQEKLIRGQRFGISGMMVLLVGTTGLIASSGQTSWDIARSLYVALILLGPIAIIYGQNTLRSLMKKYLRPFELVA